MYAGLQFHKRLVSLVAGTIADRKLLEEHRRRFRQSKGGPVPVMTRIADYIRHEQRLRRSPRGCPPSAASCNK